MDERERFALYEKIYFHEMDRKEKLISRLNLPLAMIVAVVSFLSYMLDKAPTTEDGYAGVFFWSSYFCTIVSLVVGSWYFWSSWQLRAFDKGLPTLLELEDYRGKAEAHFSVYGENEDDAETYFKSVILGYYIEGATTNTKNNDKRTGYLASLASYVTLTIVLAVFSFLPFYLHQQEVKSHEQSEAAPATSTAHALYKER